MKKNKHILTFIGLLAILVNFSSCFLLFPFVESEKGKKEKDTIEKRYATKTYEDLKTEGLKLLQDSFPGQFEFKQKIKNEEEFKQFAYYSSELKKNVTVTFRWTSTYFEESVDGKEKQTVCQYFWDKGTSYFAEYSHPFEQSYDDIIGEWFTDHAEFFDYTKCNSSVYDDYEKAKIDEYIDKHYFDIWTNSTVNIAVKMPQNEYGYSADAWTKVFMFYFNQYIFDSKYLPVEEHSIKMDGNLFYIKDGIDINTVTAQNLKDKDFIKNNCVKAYSFSAAGNTYGTYGEFKNE